MIFIGFYDSPPDSDNAPPCLLREACGNDADNEALAVVIEQAHLICEREGFEGFVLFRAVGDNPPAYSQRLRLRRISSFQSVISRMASVTYSGRA